MEMTKNIFEAQQKGVDDFVTKPVEFDLLNQE